MIIDRRSALHRQILKLWRNWEAAPPRWLDPIARRTARINAWFLERRLAARDPLPECPFLVSIGNLISGGGGKTPLVMDLARTLSSRGVVGAILTRGYGSPLRGPLIVEADDRRCGDEARMMSGTCPDWRVVQSRDRLEGLRLLADLSPAPGVVIIEDGFQTAGVPRHLDMLILDRWTETPQGVEPATGYRLPWGPYREGAEAAERADIWILNRIPAEGLDAIATDGRIVLAMQRRSRIPTALIGKGEAPYGIISGLADPQDFETACAAGMTREPAIIGRFPDHAAYDRAALQPIWRAARDQGVKCWLCTAKDRVKLDAIWPADLDLHDVGLDIEWAANRCPADLVVERIRRGDHEHR